MMTSFGDGIRQTPLELAALLAAVSNGGTLYYLQYPRNSKEIEQFQPRVKRHLDIARFIPQIKPGLAGAVEFGTARRAAYDAEAPVCGKTGTCTGGTAHLGWFGSFNDFGQSRIVTVVLLTGARGVSGPTASQVTGAIYRKLEQQGYFGHRPVFSPAVLIPR
jgi:cell division protein FtsI/penicillin-binding protein 2